MAFVTENSTVVSFAEYSDILERDQRLIESNEGLTDDVVEPLLIRATERILIKLRSSEWWQGYYLNRATNFTYSTAADIPALDPNRIKARQSDFTDLCVYTAFNEYILPLVADFGNEDSSERKKMGYYSNRAETLFGELIAVGDWYDFDNSGTIASTEKDPGRYNLKRVR